MMLKTFSYGVRIYLCELLFKWSLRVAPRDYVPSYVETITAMRERAH